MLWNEEITLGKMFCKELVSLNSVQDCFDEVVYGEIWLERDRYVQHVQALEVISNYPDTDQPHQRTGVEPGVQWGICIPSLGIPVTKLLVLHPLPKSWLCTPKEASHRKVWILCYGTQWNGSGEVPNVVWP